MYKYPTTPASNLVFETQICQRYNNLKTKQGTFKQLKIALVSISH